MKTITINNSMNQVKTTLGWMNKFKNNWKACPEWVEMARAICRSYNAQTREEETEAVRCWIKENIGYRLDPQGVEYLQTPYVLMQTREGDCDDMACLAGLLLACVGHECQALGIIWEGDETPGHAVLWDETTELVCDPVSEVRCSEWPGPGCAYSGYEVGR